MSEILCRWLNEDVKLSQKVGEFWLILCKLFPVKNTENFNSKNVFRNK